MPRDPNQSRALAAQHARGARPATPPAPPIPSFVAAPERLTIINLATNDKLTVQRNPEKLEEKYETNWTRQVVPGLSHEVLQFVGTKNVKFTLELPFDAMVVDPKWLNLPLSVVKKNIERTGSAFLVRNEMEESRRFLEALCYPREAQQKNSLAASGPPRALVIWPDTLSMTCICTNLDFSHERFSYQGASTRYIAKVTFEEIRDTRLTSEAARLRGSMRQR